MRKFSVCAVALCLALASSTHAATKTRIKFRGTSAQASAEFHSADGCVDAFFGLTASDEVSKDGTFGTTSSRSAFAGYGGRDLCNFLSFGGNLVYPLTAPLNTTSVTIPFDFVVDYAQTETDERSQRRVVGTVTITATSDFEKSRDTIIIDNDNIRTVQKSKGNTREADVTVNATLDGVPLTWDSGSGSLGIFQLGTVESVRN